MATDCRPGNNCDRLPDTASPQLPALARSRRRVPGSHFARGSPGVAVQTSVPEGCSLERRFERPSLPDLVVRTVRHEFAGPVRQTVPQGDDGGREEDRLQRVEIAVRDLDDEDRHHDEGDNDQMYPMPTAGDICFGRNRNPAIRATVRRKCERKVPDRNVLTKPVMLSVCSCMIEPLIVAIPTWGVRHRIWKIVVPTIVMARTAAPHRMILQSSDSLNGR